MPLTMLPFQLRQDADAGPLSRTRRKARRNKQQELSPEARLQQMSGQVEACRCGSGEEEGGMPCLWSAPADSLEHHGGLLQGGEQAHPVLSRSMH